MDHQDFPNPADWLTQLWSPGPPESGTLLILVSSLLSNRKAPFEPETMISQWSWARQARQFHFKLSEQDEEGGVTQALEKIFAFLQTDLPVTSDVDLDLDEEGPSSPKFLFPVDQALRQELSLYMSQADWQRLKRFLGRLWESLTGISQCLKACSPQLESELKGIRSALAALQSFAALEKLQIGDEALTQRLQRGLEEWKNSLVEMGQVISRLIREQPRPWSNFVWLEADLRLTGRERLAGSCAEWSTWLLDLRRDLALTATPLWNSRGPEIDLIYELWLTLEHLHQSLLELSQSDDFPLDLDAKMLELGELLGHLGQVESALTEYFSLNWPEVPTTCPWADLLAAHPSSRLYSSSGRWWKKLMETLRPMLEWLIDEPRADLVLDFDDDFLEGLDVTELYQLTILPANKNAPDEPRRI